MKRLHKILSVMPPRDPRRPVKVRTQVFHGADHLTQRREGFRRRFGVIRSGSARQDDRIASAIQKRERTWEA